MKYARVDDGIVAKGRAVSLALLLTVTTPALTGCAALIGGVVGGLADNLTTAILDSNDVDTVRDGVPAYLLMVDALVATAPKNAGILLAASKLYGAYAGGFVEDSERSKRLTDKSFNYTLTALCQKDKTACDIRTMPIKDFEIWLVGAAQPKNTELLYAVGVSWAGWIQSHSSDWNAVAELARVRLLMAQVLALDETLDYGGPHLYYGVFETLLPVALGGKPEVGKKHFEKAVALSQGRYLMTKVMYARQYARLVYDRELHDKLLSDVVAADASVDGITIVNLLAQQQAQMLLDSADDYF